MTDGRGSVLPTRSEDSGLSDLVDRCVKPVRVDDFYKLRGFLSRSCTHDSYCRSAVYFAFTGRGKVWTLECNDSHLILLPHPNLGETLLVFFPFVRAVSEFVEQVRVLCRCSDFLSDYREVLLARIPEAVSLDIFETELPFLRGRLERMDERKLDWAYPSYDVNLENLVEPRGGRLKTYRKKIKRFLNQNQKNIEVIRAKQISQEELIQAVSQVNKGWIRTKLKTGVSLTEQGITLKDLMAPYRTLARLSRNVMSQIDGLILRRENSCIAFSFWERPTKGCTVVPCFAALPSSYEKGLSEYLYYCIAVQLGHEEYKHMGIDRLCIGGSETASLDRFKKKLDPVEEHKLQTIRFFSDRIRVIGEPEERSPNSVSR
jgi:hypothetical protein